MSCFKILNKFCRPKFSIKSQLLELKGQRDDLDHYKVILEDRMSKLTQESLVYARKGDNESAIFTLRRKALIKKQVIIIDEYIIKLLTVISDTEMAKIQLDVVEHLKLGAKLMATISKEIKSKDIDSIHEIESQCLEDMANAMGVYNSQYLSETDEYVLLNELDDLVHDVKEDNQFINHRHTTPQYKQTDMNKNIVNNVTIHECDANNEPILI